MILISSSKFCLFWKAKTGVKIGADHFKVQAIFPYQFECSEEISQNKSLIVESISESYELNELERVQESGRKTIRRYSLRWCLFFWLFTESNLVLEFTLFVFVFFHDLL